MFWYLSYFFFLILCHMIQRYLRLDCYLCLLIFDDVIFFCSLVYGDVPEGLYPVDFHFELFLFLYFCTVMKLFALFYIFLLFLFSFFIKDFLHWHTLHYSLTKGMLVSNSQVSQGTTEPCEGLGENQLA